MYTINLIFLNWRKSCFKNELKSLLKLMTKRAATKTRTVNRLIQKYYQYGKAGFIHGNRRKSPSTTVSLDKSI